MRLKFWEQQKKDQIESVIKFMCEKDATDMYYIDTLQKILMIARTECEYVLDIQTHVYTGYHDAKLQYKSIEKITVSDR